MIDRYITNCLLCVLFLQDLTQEEDTILHTCAYLKVYIQCLFWHRFFLFDAK